MSGPDKFHGLQALIPPPRPQGRWPVGSHCIMCDIKLQRRGHAGYLALGHPFSPESDDRTITDPSQHTSSASGC